jgi:hypothetical protein
MTTGARRGGRDGRGWRCRRRCRRSRAERWRRRAAPQPSAPGAQTLGLGGAPVHIFGPVEAENFFGQFGGQDLGGGAAPALDGCANIFTLGVGDFFKRSNRHAGLLRKGLGGGGGRAVFEGDLPRGAGQLSSVSAWLVNYAFDQHGQPARRRVSGQFGSRAEQALASEQIADAAAQLGFGPGYHAGWNFFEANFQQENPTLL